jgi:hypothetical protein
MTFKKFEELFKSKYPSGAVCRHGEFAQTEKNKKVALAFSEASKVYEYYGAYEDILCKIGIPCISKERLSSLKQTLNQYKEWHGEEDFFGGVRDCSDDIAKYTAEIENYSKNYIIV